MDISANICPMVTNRMDIVREDEELSNDIRLDENRGKKVLEIAANKLITINKTKLKTYLLQEAKTR